MENIQVLNIEIPKDFSDLKLPNPDTLRYYSDRENRILYLDGVVEANLMFDIGGQIIEYNRQDKGKPIEERKKIVVLINSPGGDLDATFPTIAIIEKSKTPVVCVNMNMAYSAAGLILLAGHERYCMPRSQILIHSGSASGISGSFEEIQESTKTYKKMIEDMRKYIIERTNIEKSLLMKKSKTDWYLCVDDQINYGCVQSILDDIDKIL